MRVIWIQLNEYHIIRDSIGFAHWHRSLRAVIVISSVIIMLAQSWLYIRFEVKIKHLLSPQKLCMTYRITHLENRSLFLPYHPYLSLPYYMFITTIIVPFRAFFNRSDRSILFQFCSVHFQPNQRYERDKMNQSYLNMQFTLWRLCSLSISRCLSILISSAESVCLLCRYVCRLILVYYR